MSETKDYATVFLETYLLYTVPTISLHVNFTARETGSTYV